MHVCLSTDLTCNYTMQHTFLHVAPHRGLAAKGKAGIGPWCSSSWEFKGLCPMLYLGWVVFPMSGCILAPLSCAISLPPPHLYQVECNSKLDPTQTSFLKVSDLPSPCPRS